ncbi:hypothetical protein [Acinetobacter sp. FDAARGOS_558]|uniref:hypothetical protein n=1 Tax=Acinetobacter sp. FDAARGOS_558 TaxID=2420303 RepID=UPI000F690C18|nr:hypothetical protein [Acinetobacter sp. FDAARGOS_558]RSC52367.1 hypothetical protein EGT34_00035 [Acinetobacter sp. FDAARGOS_558]
MTFTYRFVKLKKIENGVIMNRVLIIFALCLVGAGCEKTIKYLLFRFRKQGKVSESNWKVVVSKDEMRNKELNGLLLVGE